MTTFSYIRALLLVFALLLTSHVAKGYRRPQRFEQISQTIREVRNVLDPEGQFRAETDKLFLDFVSRDSKTFVGVKKYISTGFQRAMRALITDAAPSFENPVILTAIVSQADDDVEDINLLSFGCLRPLGLLRFTFKVNLGKPSPTVQFARRKAIWKKCLLSRTRACP